MSCRRSRPRESGIALLVVLLSITLLTIVVVEFTDYAQVETHLALSTRNALQATYLARSGVNVAEALVSVDLTLGSDGGPEDFWARPWPPFPVGDGSAVFQVRDEARFLNLNAMVVSGARNRDRIEVFVRLFTVLGLDKQILWSIVDWIDPDQNPNLDPPGAEQPHYFGFKPPRFVRNGPLLTLRELLLVRGMNPTILARLEKFVTVLPPTEDLKVNLNTAPKQVLSALSVGMLANSGIVDRLVETRETAPFVDRNEALDSQSALRATLGTSEQFVEISSTYFRVEAVGEVDEVRRGIVELVKRDGRRVTRVTWTPSTANLTLTSLPPSDFLATLPVFGDR